MLLCLVFYCLIRGVLSFDLEDYSGKCADIKFDRIERIERSIDANPNGITVYVSQFSITEQTTYEKLNSALTMSNPDMGIGKVRGLPAAEKWVNNVPIDGITDNHPRSNRSNCLYLTIESSKYPLPMYDVYIFPHNTSITSTSTSTTTASNSIIASNSKTNALSSYNEQYILHTQYGIIHDIGK